MKVTYIAVILVQHFVNIFYVIQLPEIGRDVRKQFPICT